MYMYLLSQDKLIHDSDILKDVIRKVMSIVQAVPVKTDADTKRACKQLKGN